MIKKVRDMGETDYPEQRTTYKRGKTNLNACLFNPAKGGKPVVTPTQMITVVK